MSEDMKAVELAEDEVRYMRIELAQCAKAEALGIRRTADIAPDRLAVLLDGYLALLSERRKMVEALEPFAAFAENVDQHGWTSDIHREAISVWFGPSDFRRAAALTGSREHG